MTGSTQFQETSDFAPWRPQDGPEPFLELWGIDSHGRWSGLFCSMVRLSALIRSYGTADGSEATAAFRLTIKRARVSPVIFWARTKAALEPVLAADDSTLAAFGISIYARTVPALALALSFGLDDLTTSDQEQQLLDLWGRW